MILQSEIEQILQDIVTNPLFGILGFLFAIISITLAILFYYKNKREKKPRYEIASENVVQDLSDFRSLEIFYDKQPIKNLTVTNVKFTNEGKMTIHKTDIASADPIIIKIDEKFQILEAEVVEEFNKANQFSIDFDLEKSLIKLSFDYLDQKEGGKVKIIHTGNDSNDFTISGSIKGAGKVKEKEKPYFFPFLLSFVLGTIMASTLFAFSKLSETLESIINILVISFAIIALIWFIILTIYDRSYLNNSNLEER